MRFKFVKLAIATAILSSSSIATFADDAANKLDEVFKTQCVKTWMERSGKTSDAVAFKNIGEKYCDCAASKPLNSKDDIKKAAQICMSQVLLHDTMDRLESDKGLANINADSVKGACNDEWNIIYPGMDAADKKSTSGYCECAAPKLMDLNSNRDNVTDKEWYQKIDGIAGDCSSKAEPDKATVDKVNPKK